MSGGLGLSRNKISGGDRAVCGPLDGRDVSPVRTTATADPAMNGADLSTDSHGERGEGHLLALEVFGQRHGPRLRTMRISAQCVISRLGSVDARAETGCSGHA